MTNRTAIVTGGNRGIGRAIAERLANEGLRVVLCARDLAALQETATSIAQQGGHAITVSADLMVPESAQEVVNSAMQEFGRIDVLVNNAGATQRGDFLDLTEEDWTTGFALKFFGAVRLTRLAWPHLKQHSGSLVNISGVGGRTPGAQFAIGGSVNAAMLSFTKAIAELGIQDGVQVNAINPGAVKTDRLTKRLQAIATSKGIELTAAAAEYVRESNTTRLGEPDDIAGLVAFMVSPAGRFLHGALIDMDGGHTKTI